MKKNKVLISLIILFICWVYLTVNSVKEAGEIIETHGGARNIIISVGKDIKKISNEINND